VCDRDEMLSKVSMDVIHQQKLLDHFLPNLLCAEIKISFVVNHSMNTRLQRSYYI